LAPLPNEIHRGQEFVIQVIDIDKMLIDSNKTNQVDNWYLVDEIE
jgi:hypothetical protein